MGAILTIIAIIAIGLLLFVLLAILGWGVQLLGFIGSFLGQGVEGCVGCLVKILFLIFAIYLVVAVL